MTLRKYLWLSMMAVLVVGCGQSIKTVPVEGMVVVDGDPVPGLTVQFEPVSGERPSTGFTDQDGRFQLRYNKDILGVLPGEQQVTFSWSQDEPGQEPTVLQAIVLAKHGEDSETPYELDIVGGTRNLVIEINTNGSAATR
jgi:hypothetical protein